MAYPPCSPKLVPLSSANSPRTLGMLLHLQLSPIWEQEALAVQQERDIVSKIQVSEGALAKRHTNRARFNSPVQQPIHACGK